ncbi:MAG: hypothetical protein KatS3mg119_2482 [Rhodothalassiaceae bacterium]|nr:MAG: hypothetical protein KatS3mg119_2482 [Rhodothalassiaceae bacterium]
MPRALAELGWEVEIIISFEMPRDLPLPFPEPFLAARDSRISGANRIAWKDHQFPCWQIPGAMPTERGLVTFLQTVTRKKPLAILDIGGNGVAADLASQITTTVALPLSAAPPIAETTFLATVGREHETGLGPDPVREELDLDAGRFLPFRYAYRLPESGGTVPDALESIPADRIRGVIVGNRLDKEISGANLDLLVSCLERVPQLHLVFVGPFQSFDMLAARHPLLGVRATALGLQNDVVAILRRCHLYLNPRRAGGGTSVAHALGCGLPVITFADGDGAYAAGPAFTVAGPEDYLARLALWARDEAARRQAGAEAERRWAAISDRRASLAAFLDLLLADDRLARPAPLFVRKRKR